MNTTTKWIKLSDDVIFKTCQHNKSVYDREANCCASGWVYKETCHLLQKHKDHVKMSIIQKLCNKDPS